MKSFSPFYVTNAAAVPIEQILELRVDREEETALITSAILERRHNVLLYGERGVGKSFLTRLVQSDIEKIDPSVLAININMTGLLFFGAGENPSTFPRVLLLQICARIWRRLLAKDYLDLRERIKETGNEITFRSRTERVVQRVYSLLMTTEELLTKEFQNSVGFSVGAKGEMKESSRSEQHQSEVLPFEFLELAEEINSCIFDEYGITRILVLCDEANHLPTLSQHALLEQYVELFSTKYVQFVFVTSRIQLEAVNNLNISFETLHHLKGFAKVGHVAEMINKVNTGGITFSPKAIDVLYDFFDGHPRNSILACERAFRNCVSKELNEVSELMMRLSCTEEREHQISEIQGMPSF